VLCALRDPSAFVTFLTQPFRLRYFSHNKQTSRNSIFLSEQISHQQPVSSTFLLKQINTGQPNKQGVRFHKPTVAIPTNVLAIGHKKRRNKKPVSSLRSEKASSVQQGVILQPVFSVHCSSSN
jgi:hypothetical protein